MSSEKKKELNARQKLFCERYIVDFNGTQAYLEVYECAYETAMVQSSRLLKKVEIREYIQELIREKVSEDLSPNRILYELMDLAFNRDNPQNIRLQALDKLSRLMGMEVTKIQMEQVVFIGEDEMME